MDGLEPDKEARGDPVASYREPRWLSCRQSQVGIASLADTLPTGFLGEGQQKPSYQNQRGAMGSLQFILLTYTWGKQGPERYQTAQASRLSLEYGNDLPFSCLWQHGTELSWTGLGWHGLRAP